jgi:hypothetical protein
VSVPDLQRRLVDLYVGDAKTPASAIDHVEALLALDPSDAAMRKAAQRLLSVREVASRAASALQGARRSTMPPPPVSQRPLAPVSQRPPPLSQPPPPLPPAPAVPDVAPARASQPPPLPPRPPPRPED